MENYYDVAIIGAGPAGATFARELYVRRPSMRILLIDGQTDQNAKPCGGLLSPDAQKVLAEFELTLPNAVLADPQIFSVHTIDLGASMTRLYQRHYLNMDRLSFDRWLLSLVPDSVQIASGRCTKIRRENGFVLHVQTKDGEHTYRAHALVGADGASSIVRRQFFREQPYKYVSVQQWFRGSDPCVPAYACIFDPKTSDSCSWLIRKDDCTIFGGA
ncbi:MAG: FAD-dependent oxidoreductase, partial [Clostridia bacterium]|nr:FAD-dependent oxidoreductase [Clostridia bacterium]